MVAYKSLLTTALWALCRTFSRDKRNKREIFNGHMAGNFKWVHNMAIASKGTIYTAEVGDGRRVQKFKRGN